MYRTVKLKIFFGSFDWDIDQMRLGLGKLNFEILEKKEPWHVKRSITLSS